ncbi:MAG: hypothetical protein ACYDEB_10720 [Dehalococcoidia bacterium]
MADIEKERAADEGVRESVRVWWGAVLAGHVDQGHPVRSRVSAEVKGEVLHLHGCVTSGEERQELIDEAAHLKGRGISEVQDNLVVQAETEDRVGVLVQTIVAVYENGAQAQAAADALFAHGHTPRGLMKVVLPDCDRVAEGLHAVLPEPNWSDADQALDAGRSLLVVVVDETAAFSARELLDEETHSLRTLIAPPELAANLSAHADERERGHSSR